MLVLAALVIFGTPVHPASADPTVGMRLTLGEPAVLALRGGRELWWGHVEVPAKLTRLHVAVHADQPVHVYVVRKAMAQDQLDSRAKHRTSTPTDAARITLEGSDAQAGTWQIAVKHPEASVRDIRFEVVVMGETDAAAPVLFSDGMSRTIEAGADGELQARLFLPRDHPRLVLRVRDAKGGREGLPALTLEGPEGFRLARQGADLLLPDRVAPAGVYTLRGRGAASARFRLRLEVLARSAAPSPQAPSAGEAVRLVDTQPWAFILGGEGGPRRLRAVLDVPAGTAGVELLLENDARAHVELLVAELKTPRKDITLADAQWLGVAHTAKQRVVLGGSGGLEAGPYAVDVVLLHGSEIVEGRLRTRFLDEAPSPDTWGERPTRPVRDGRWQRGSIEVLRTGTTWYRVPVPPGSTSLHALLLDATAPLDLVLAQPGDGRLLARAFTQRVDERIDYVFPETTERDQELMLGVICGGTEERRASWRIGVGVDAVPALPADYAFPPVMRTLGMNPLERASAAVVEISGLGTGVGSGVCVSPYGRILTCRHVLETGSDGAGIQRDRLIVAFPRRLDEPPVQAFLARVVYEDRELDLAVLEITRDIFGRRLARDLVLPHLGLPPGGERPRLGEAVQVLGYPADGSPRSRTPIVASSGRVAGLERDRGRLRWIKTDAWIGRGHSGGALLDEDQALLGIAAATLGQGEALGLAIPLALLPAEWRQWIEGR